MAKELFGVCKNCDAKCCRNYAVTLTSFDIKRIKEKTGYLEFFDIIDAGHFDTKLAQSFILFENGVPVEYFLILKRKKNGRCIFLEKDNSCKIYCQRPLVCRVYPFEAVGDCIKEIGHKEKFRCPSEWETDSKIREEFEKNKKWQEEELKKFGIMCRKWNAEQSRNGNLEKFLEFLLENIEVTNEK